jgi:DNA-directed RNA polymerase specialized sigma24 family protein
MQKAVGAAVAALPLLQSDALILATYDELSLREIAETLLVEVGTVKSAAPSRPQESQVDAFSIEPKSYAERDTACR